MAAKPWNGDSVRYLDVATQAQLVAWVGQQLGITLAELRKALQVERGQRMYLSPVWWVLAKHDLRRKKALYAAGRDAPRVVVLCGALIKAVARREDPRRFKFLDKTGPRLVFARRYGRTPDKQRVGQGVPLRRGTPVTLIGVLTINGLEAVMSLDGALNAASFAVYLAQVLGPTLVLGDVVVLDNLLVHHVGGLFALVEARRVHLLFLPPYSLDFAPIEQAGSKCKSTLRIIMARTRYALGHAFD